MTVNELYEKWLYNGKENTRLEILDRSECEYVVSLNFSSKEDCDKYKSNYKEIENTTVGNFTTFYDKELGIEVLSINVDKLGE